MPEPLAEHTLSDTVVMQTPMCPRIDGCETHVSDTGVTWCWEHLQETLGKVPKPHYNVPLSADGKADGGECLRRLALLDTGVIAAQVGVDCGAYVGADITSSIEVPNMLVQTKRD